MPESGHCCFGQWLHASPATAGRRYANRLASAAGVRTVALTDVAQMMLQRAMKLARPPGSERVTLVACANSLQRPGAASRHAWEMGRLWTAFFDCDSLRCRRVARSDQRDGETLLREFRQEMDAGCIYSIMSLRETWVGSPDCGSPSDHRVVLAA